jgi:hypothetical protein
MIAEAIGSDFRAHPIASAGHWLAQKQPAILTCELLNVFREL